MRLYYLIWVDLILKAMSQPANKNNWQVMTMIFMTVAMAVDFLFIITILEKYILGYYFYELEIPFFSAKIGEPISFVILFVIPPLAINYLLIFRNRRYEKLIKNYEYHGGKLAATCILLALFVPAVALFLGIIYEKI